MVIKMTKYCIMTEDLKQVEVGQSRQYSFIPINDLENSGTKIQLFCSFQKAKTSFLRSWYGIKWDEEKQMFIGRAINYVIKKLTITYDIDLDNFESKSGDEKVEKAAEELANQIIDAGKYPDEPTTIEIKLYKPFSRDVL